MKQATLLWIPALPLIGAAFNLIFGRFMSRRTVHAVAVAAVVAAAGYAGYLVIGPLWDVFQAWRGNKTEVMGGLYQNVYTWIEAGGFKVELAFRMDTLSAVMVLVVTVVGALIHIYSTGYMADEPRYAAYFGYLNLFTGAMLILVLGNNLPVMFIGWEGVGLCSYLLIGFWFTEPAFAYAGRKAFVVNRIGDFGFLLGICLLFWATGTVDFFSPDPNQPSLMTEGAVGAFRETFVADERLAMFAGLLLFIGAAGKSAQIPLYVWLPDAMAGPTPVSALIHAATMVTAGVYMVARMSFLYAHSTTAMAVVAGVGALTALFAAIMAFAQTDLKKVLAYSTVSQLGFMFVGVGVGAYVAGIFHLVTHAFFKAGLFLAAGSVMHAMSGSGDITKMGGLRKYLPITHFCFLVYCLAIAGIVPLAGFFSKDEILVGAFGTEAQGWFPLYGKVLWIVLSVAALGTAFYMFRLYYLVFAGENRSDPETRSHIHESPWSMTGPLILLALGTGAVGFLGLPHLSYIQKYLPNFMADWLDPSLVDFGRPSLEGSIHQAHGTDVGLLTLMGIALGIGVVGILLAAALYGKGPSAWVHRFTAGAGAEIYRLAKNKFYVDELYDRIIVRPFRWVALGVFEVIDRFVIDFLLVEGSAFVVDLFGRIARWFQNGQVQRYMVGLVLGGALILYFATRPDADFDWQQTDALTIQLEADVGKGPGSDGAVVQFSCADEPIAWKKGDPPVVVDCHFAQPGTYDVTMWLTDAVFKNKGSVTKEVTVEAADEASAAAVEAAATTDEGSGARTPVGAGGEQ